MSARLDDLDVVIVNWNTGEYLAECLASIPAAAQTARGEVRVFVVDNASSDDSLRQAERWLAEPTTTLVRNTQNAGFAAACNQGARLGTAPLLLFLNPDTRLLAGSLDRVREFLAGPGGRVVGICGVRVLDLSGRPTIVGGPFPTPRLLFGKVTGLSRVAPDAFPQRHPSAPEHSQLIDHVIGAFMVVRRELFEQVDGFDERYFMYYEEVDLCLRARKRGWTTFHLADTSVVHVGNVSSDQIRPTRLFYSLRSRRQYARQHWSRAANVALPLLTFGVELPARMLVEVARHRRSLPAETVTGYWRYARDLLGSRRRRLG